MSDINELIMIIFTHVNDNIMYCHSICQFFDETMQSHTSYSPGSLVPRPSARGEGRPGTHCLGMCWIFPTFQKFRITLRYLRVVIRHSRILSHNFAFQRRHECTKAWERGQQSR